MVVAAHRRSVFPGSQGSTRRLPHPPKPRRPARSQFEAILETPSKFPLLGVFLLKQSGRQRTRSSNGFGAVLLLEMDQREGLAAMVADLFVRGPSQRPRKNRQFGPQQRHSAVGLLGSNYSGGPLHCNQSLKFWVHPEDQDVGWPCQDIYPYTC